MRCSTGGVSAPAGGLREGIRGGRRRAASFDSGGSRVISLLRPLRCRRRRVVVTIELVQLLLGRRPGSGERGDGRWHAFEFWSGTDPKIGGGPEATLMPAAEPARCGLLLALRPSAPAASGRAQLVGTNVHVSCGLEVALWRQGSGSGGGSRHVELQLKAGRAVDSPREWIHLPGTSAIKDAGRAPSASGVVDVTWVADAVWVITLSPIDRAGESTLCRVEY